MKKVIFLILAILSFSFSSAQMIPDRPGLGDSPFLVNPGHFQIESGVDMFQKSTDGAYGILRFSPVKQVEIRAVYFQLLHTWDKPDITKTPYDYKAGSIGVKIKIVDQKSIVPTTSLNLYMDNARINIPSFNDTMFSCKTAYRGMLSVQHSFFKDKLSLGGNIGDCYIVPTEDAYGDNPKYKYKHKFMWSASAFMFIDKFTFCAEMYSKYYSIGRHEDFNYDIGVGYKVFDNFQFDISAIHETNWFPAFGIAWMFPK